MKPKHPFAFVKDIKGEEKFQLGDQIYTRLHGELPISFAIGVPPSKDINIPAIDGHFKFKLFAGNTICWKYDSLMDTKNLNLDSKVS